jgi:hypothetical protein
MQYSGGAVGGAAGLQEATEAQGSRQSKEFRGSPADVDGQYVGGGGVDSNGQLLVGDNGIGGWEGKGGMVALLLASQAS